MFELIYYVMKKVRQSLTIIKNYNHFKLWYDAYIL